MDFSKYRFKEINRINIYANLLIDDTINEIQTMPPVYLNYYKKNKDHSDLYIYYYLIVLIKNNMDMLLDIPSILDGNLLNNKYNRLMTEDNILLLFLKIKINVIKEITKIIPKEDFLQELFQKKIVNYESFLDKDTKLLESDLDKNERIKIIRNEIIKSRIYLISFYLVLSFYFYKYQDKELFLNYLDKVEFYTNKYLDEVEDINVDNFWNYLITSI